MIEARRRFGVRVALMAAMMAAFATGASAQKQGGTLRIYNTTQPPSASIHEESTIATNMPFMAIFSNLVRFDPQKPRGQRLFEFPDLPLLNFQSVVYRFTPDAASSRAVVTSQPPLAGLQTPTSVPLQTGPCNDWRSGLRADFGQPLRPLFAGAYPTQCGARDWPVAFSAADELLKQE